MVMRVSEVYASTQGEGPNVGKTTVFLRFGGCNLRCPGWPCDTQHAIDPKFRFEWKKYSVKDLFDLTTKTAEMAGAKIITFTGGEPFLQPKDDLCELTQMFHLEGYQVECFSNGTILYPVWAPANINFIMDWKLPGAGEDPLNKNRLTNLQLLNSATEHFRDPAVHHAVKFVIKDEWDLQAAHGLWSSHLKDSASHVEVYYGKVWKGSLADKDLVEYVMRNGLPWRLNVQMHNYVWPANERGR